MVSRIVFGTMDQRIRVLGKEGLGMNERIDSNSSSLGGVEMQNHQHPWDVSLQRTDSAGADDVSRVVDLYLRRPSDTGSVVLQHHDDSHR